MLDKLTTLGMSSEDAQALRRIAMILGSWSEKECGIDAGHIERDEQTDIPYWHPAGFYASGRYIQPKPYRIPDREKGALRRLEALRSRYPDLIFYHQTDPRGAAIYVLKLSDIPAGSPVESVYSGGVAVWKGH